MMKIFHLTVICFLWGCTTVPVPNPYRAADKIQSIDGHDLPIIENVSHHTDSAGASLTLTADIENYLREITGTIFLASNIDKLSAESIVLDSTKSYDPKENETTITEAITIKFEGAEGHGCAFAISPDGYFMTAAHVIDDIEGRILFDITDFDSLKSSYVFLPYRIVMKDSIADVAVIKVNLVVPFHIDITSAVIPQAGDSIYNGGNRFSPTSHGQIKYVQEMGSSYFLATTAPIVAGDSGSAGVNSTGQLLGVATSTRGNKKFRKTVFAMLSPARINEAIELDRDNERANQAVDTTAANARLFDDDTSKSTSPDMGAMTDAAVVSP